ncbi:MAG: 3-phosphoshikimate 1-carboxyvinyltransferase [Candidatus Obscuribacterales bacterium]|nr:3-phosphoshikimate 1-carboxyvinyltransferase [Candidatus Obscuribacterales bacterium]
MLKPTGKLLGELKVPGDKSITHRAFIFAAFTKGISEVDNLSPAADCYSTIECMRMLGLDIQLSDAEGQSVKALVKSPGHTALHPAQLGLFAGNSGTTIRLLSGLLAGQPFKAKLDGDESLRSRPMKRVIEPLNSMNVCVAWLGKEGHAPFVIEGAPSNNLELKAHKFKLQVASAQVQTALLLAGLQADGKTTVELPAPVRDHTVRLFRHIGVPMLVDEPLTTAVQKLDEPLPPFKLNVVADISSATFFMVASALLPGSDIKLLSVGVNKGRRLVIDVLKEMGADIQLENEMEYDGEPVADVVVRYNGRLRGVTIDGGNIAAGIDEIPALSLLGCLADGKFVVSGASELRVKESDRLSAMVANLKAAGANINEKPDGYEIEGHKHLRGASIWQTFGDHRLAMTGLIANLICQEPLAIDDTLCVAVSYPTFIEDLNRLLIV